MYKGSQQPRSADERTNAEHDKLDDVPRAGKPADDMTVIHISSSTL
jgi:hypothetical protein